MGFMRVRRGDGFSPPVGNEPRGVVDSVMAWARRREDIVAVMSPGGAVADQTVQEILLLVTSRGALAADDRWHEAACGGIVVIRERIDLPTISSRLLRLADGSCVQFWIADAPSELLTEMTNRPRAARA